MNTTFEVSLFVALWLGLLTGYIALVALVRPAVLANYHLWVKRGSKDDDQISWDREWIRIWGQRAREWRASGLKVIWPSLGIWPEFYRWVPAEKEILKGRVTIPWREREPISVRRLDGRGETPAQWISGWQVGDRLKYLLTTDHDWKWWSDWTPTMKVWWVAGWIIIALFVLQFAWTKISDLRAAPEPTTAPTTAPQPTATPEPQVEVIEGGNSIVIDLDEQAPADALLEWLNGLTGLKLLRLPRPLEEWLNGLPFPEVAAFELPEGMDGFVVVARKGDGFELLRLDEIGNPLGGALALIDANEFTLHARELQWGVRYTDQFRVTGASLGQLDVFVTEAGQPPMAVGYHIYNFRWWHVAVVILVIAIGIVVYRRINY